VEALGLGRRSGSAHHLLLTPSSCRLARRAQYPTSWGVEPPGPWATLGKPSLSPCVEGVFSEVRRYGVLRSSLHLATPKQQQEYALWGMHRPALGS
jgi:hypothetical protein